MCQSKIKKEIIKKFNISISKTYIYYIIRYKLNITYKQLRQNKNFVFILLIYKKSMIFYKLTKILSRKKIIYIKKR